MRHKILTVSLEYMMEVVPNCTAYMRASTRISPVSILKHAHFLTWVKSQGAL